MSKAFKLPDLGEGIHEGEIIAVHVSVGDDIKEGDIILEVETDKATVEIPSPYTGKVTEINVKPGDIVNVGDVLVTFDGDGEEKVPAELQVEETVAPTQKAEAKETVEIPPPDRQGKPVPASPATRRFARELGVNLAQVPPSGPAGLVVAEDVKNFAARGTAETPAAAEKKPKKAAEAPAAGRPLVVTIPPLPDFSAYGPVRREAVRSIRRATARRMTISWSQIPHVNSQDSADITRLEELRTRQKEQIRQQGGRLTLMVFVLKAVATALKKFPSFNATLDVEAGEIIYKNYYHIGVAVDTRDGLIVPVLRDVDRKSVNDLAFELTELVDRTRDRKTSLDDIRGGTFTITNAGAMGGGHFSPIINYPEVAILGLGQARWQPVVNTRSNGDHTIVPRLLMPMVLTIDHRVLDGADAIRFLKFLGDTLKDPEQMLMNLV